MEKKERRANKQKHHKAMTAFKSNHKIKRGLSWHHIENSVNGGEENVQNLLRIYIHRHQEWHNMFKNRNIDEAISFLKRVKRAKENQSNDNFS